MACSVEKCGRPVVAHGWCAAHYMRVFTTGELRPEVPIFERANKNARLKHYLEVVKPAQTDECISWPFPLNSRGRAVMKIDGKQHRVHRYVCAEFHGQPPTQTHHAAHSCGNGWCVNHRHLRWATPSENQADRLLHGTDGRGERHPLSRLTEDDVTAIRAVHGKENRRVTARRFGVSYAHIKSIQIQRAWAWMEV